jgi:RNA-directed DNA polymerase
LDKVRALQHTLYRTAKADPGRRFHALQDKVLRRDVLRRAWVAVRANNGAPGVDRTTLDWIEKEFGIDRLLDELSSELRDGSYRPHPARRVYIPKPGTTEQRPLSIPAVRDRIVQAATKIVLEPIFEADFADCSFGFRPKRSQHDALQVLVDETFRGRRWVVETDIADCFSAIPHDRLMQAVEERVCDQSVLKLLRAMLRAGVMEAGLVRHSDTGTPQGGVITPPTQWAMCGMVVLRVGVGGGFGVVGGALPDRDTVADGDLVGSDENVFDEQPQCAWRSSTVDSLALALSWVRKPSRSQASLR